MTSRILPVALFLLLTGCGTPPAEQGKPQQPAGDPPPAQGVQVAGAPQAEAPATPPAAADPAEVKTFDVTSGEVLSVNNSMGDRINLEKITWPPILGPNSWEISFKAAANAPMEIGDHLGLEISRVEAGEHPPSINSSYSGGMSGGTFLWEPTIAGTYEVRVFALRKRQQTGPIIFRIAVPEA